LKPSEWDKLLADMLKLRDEIFDCISASVCYEVGRQLASVAWESQHHRFHSCHSQGLYRDSVYRKVDNFETALNFTNPFIS
jgi:hypothetical protein